MTYDEFRVKILKANKKKYKYKINNSYGLKDAYRWAIKNKYINRNITEANYRVIVNTINQYFQDRLLQGYDVKFPERMGVIEIRKYNTHISFEDGKLVTNMAVDWDKTLRLWYEDSEAYSKKTLVRCEAKERFKIFYNKRRAKYKNKDFYEFAPTRNIKIKLKNIIKDKGFDALLLYNDYGLHKCKCYSRQNKKESTT